MKPRPELAIVAGPNGAGKSRLSPFYIHCDCFDGDAIAMRLRTEHPEWEERWYAGTVASILEKQMNEALEKHLSFAFETNFASRMPVDMIHRFRDAGYKICLYYFGLESAAVCCERVAQRVSLGGHNVSDEVIEYNYSEGIRVLLSCLTLFDNLTFIDSTTGFGNIVAMYIGKSGRFEQKQTLPAWYEQHFARPMQELKEIMNDKTVRG